MTVEPGLGRREPQQSEESPLLRSYWGFRCHFSMTAATLDRYAYRLGPNDQSPQIFQSLRRLGIAAHTVAEDRGVGKVLSGGQKNVF